MSARYYEMTRSADVRHEVGSQQKDYLCGPFWAARLLRDAGIASWNGEPVDQDALAVWAGTTLPDSEQAELPPGAHSLTGYRHALPRVPPSDAGTTADAIAEVVEAATNGAFRVVPLCGSWTGERVEQLLDGAAKRRRPHTFSPTNISWGFEDRSAFVRVKGGALEHRHIENRAPTGLSNPYLAGAALLGSGLLGSGLLGIEDKPELEPPARAPAEEDPSKPPLPTTVAESLALLEDDKRIADRAAAVRRGRDLL